MLRAWNPSQKVTIKFMDTNIFSCIFDCKEDMSRALNLSWSFRDHQVILKQWSPEMAYFDVDFSSAAFWCHISRLPVCYITPSNAITIGNQLGSFLGLEASGLGSRWRRAFKFRVEIDISQPVIDKILFTAPDGKSFLVEVRFERLAGFCHCCSLLGHRIQGCTAVTANATDMPPLQCYGDWLCTESPHSLNPSFRTGN